MPSIRTKFSVGLFVILGMSLVIVSVLWLGMSQYFKEGRHYVAFFDESVQGLKKDSAIKYRGVEIGLVENIRVAPDGKLIRILFNLDEPLTDSDKMVAQIKSIGITGIMFVELERMKKGDLLRTPKLIFETKFPVIATKPSEMKQLLTDIYAILDKINQIDVKGISDKIIQTLDNANQTFEDAQVKKVSENIQETLVRTHKILDTDEWIQIRNNIFQASKDMNRLIATTGDTVSRIDGSLKKHNKNLTTSLDEFQTAAANASTLLQNGSGFINDTRSRISTLDEKLLETLNSLEAASNNMNNLIQQIMDQPSMLLFSSPPAPKPIESMDN
jgi:phospholipid/cholesterol/gamma-HCH transport system substrate-binding protein